MLKDIEDYNLNEIVVHHINCYEEAKELANAIGEKLNININVCALGPVIGLHVGPGTVAIAYYTEKILDNLLHPFSSAVLSLTFLMSYAIQVLSVRTIPLILASCAVPDGFSIA